MTCPYCRQEMQKGELTGDGGHGITWWPSEGPSWNRVIVAKSTFLPSKAEAFYCASCRKVIIDTER